MFLLAALTLSPSEASACGMYIPDDYALAELILELDEPTVEEEPRTLAETFLDLAPAIDEVAPEPEPSSPDSAQPLS